MRRTFRGDINLSADGEVCSYRIRCVCSAVVTSDESEIVAFYKLSVHYIFCDVLAAAVGPPAEEDVVWWFKGRVLDEWGHGELNRE